MTTRVLGGFLAVALFSSCTVYNPPSTTHITTEVHVTGTSPATIVTRETPKIPEGAASTVVSTVEVKPKPTPVPAVKIRHVGCQPMVLPDFPESPTLSGSELLRRASPSVKGAFTEVMVDHIRELDQHNKKILKLIQEAHEQHLKTCKK